MSQYSWVPVFQAIANELPKYENKQKLLIQWLKDIGIEKGLTDQAEENFEIELEEIDPFTFFSMFMKYERTRRREYFKGMIEKLGLSLQVPDDFHGVPSAQALKVWLFPFKKDRNLNDIPTLWRLFNEALDNRVDPNTFSHALKVKSVGFAKLTQCLFYCFPDRYFPIDSQTRPLLQKHNIEIPEKDWGSYQACLNKIKSEFNTPFYELSYIAWQENRAGATVESLYLPREKNICLIGTWKTVVDNLAMVQKSITEKGGWASWWSFVIGKDVQKELTTPFYFYPNAGKGTFPVRLLIDEYVTSRGNDGILSPWQDITEINWKNKRTLSNKKNQIFKTWIKVVKAELLTHPLTLSDFEPAEPFSNNTNLLNQNCFGYVYEKEGVTNGTVEEPKTALPTYSYEESMKDIFIEDSKIRDILNLLEIKKNIVLQGPPGVGKTYIAKRLGFALLNAMDTGRVQMIQFHQSYSYEDFIQGYRPSNQGFKLKKGLFYKFCEKAKSDPSNKYVFIIDEINRGNLSKIFGELMMLVENDKRGPDWAIPLTYSDELDEKFYVPENVYFIGLMNTADRSLAVVDYALRRRFSFIDLEPSFDTDKFKRFLIANGADESIVSKITRRIGQLNREISEDTVNLGRGFCIGHSFFCSPPINGIYNDNWYEQIIKTEIGPLLHEYWFDAPERATSLIDNLL